MLDNACSDSSSDDEPVQISVSEFAQDLSDSKRYTANWTKNYNPLVGQPMFEYAPKLNANKERGNPGWAEYIA